MDVNQFLELFAQYGLIFLFVIVFLEYMNLPGLPAGIIMPAAGILVAQAKLNITVAILVSVIAGILGSLVLYALGWYGGTPVLEKWAKKSEKIKKILDKCHEIVHKHGHMGLTVCRLIPVLRTLISIPAGVLRIPPVPFICYSAIGIFGWNLAYILFGYFFGRILL